jgi:hypothetical protein
LVPDRSCTDALGFRTYHNESDYRWRIEKITKAVISCQPNSLGCIELPYREASETYSNNKTYPRQYNHQHKNYQMEEKGLNRYRKLYDLSVFSAPRQAVNIVKEFLKEKLKGRKLITITLRTYKHHSDRNSDLEQWLLFLRSLDTSLYFPVIVKDTYNCTVSSKNEMDNYLSFPLASVDFSLRLALYESAYINMCVSNGPTAIFNFVKNLSSITCIKADDSNPVISSRAFEQVGIKIGGDILYKDNQFQTLLWGQEDAQKLTNVFNELCQLKESSDIVYKGIGRD